MSGGAPFERQGAPWVIVMAASAGGLSALRTVLSGIEADTPAAIVIAQHLDPRHPSMLASLLGRHTALRVQAAASGDRLAAGTAYVAPPDRHVLVGPDGRLSLSVAERVRFQRPSADVLFASAAASCGARVIAVVLSGSGTDGAEGVQAVQAAGGQVLVHNPAEAEFPGMPQAAVDAGVGARVLALDQIAPALQALVAVGGPSR